MKNIRIGTDEYKEIVSITAKIFAKANKEINKKSKDLQKKYRLFDRQQRTYKIMLIERLQGKLDKQLRKI